MFEINKLGGRVFGNVLVGVGLAVAVGGLLTTVRAVEPVSPLVVDAADRYSAYYTATQSGTALKSTLQSPVGASKRTFLEAVTVETSAACDFNIEMGGSAATTTLLTTRPLNTGALAQTQSFGPSNVGAGTQITAVTLTAGDVRTIALSGVVLASGATSTRNISVVPQCTTGTIKITWKFAHQKGN